MGNQVILFDNGSPSVGICTPTGELPIDVVFERDLPGITRKVIVDTDSFPSDIAFTEAWDVNYDTGEVILNIDRAKDVWRTKLRLAREPLLSHLDLLFQRIGELDNPQNRSLIIQKKNLLRDVTKDPRFDTATTLHEIQEIWLPMSYEDVLEIKAE